MAPPPFPTGTLVTSKSDLRVQLRLRRRELALTHPDAAEKAAEHLLLLDLPAFKVVSGYHPLGGELDPGPVLQRLQAHGARVALPVALDRHSPLIFRAFEPGQTLAPDAVRVPSPTPDAERLEPDLVITPLLGFDRHGHRLGQGAGHYDRTLEALRAARRIWVIGLAYSGQEVEDLPCEPHDQRLDAILTEKGYRSLQR